MNKDDEEYLEYDYGSMCDCCGTTDEGQELHSLDVLCEITLCRSCIQQFYALLHHGTKDNGRLIVLKGNNEKE